MIRSQSYRFIGIITIYSLFFLHPLLNTFATPTHFLCRDDQRDALLELQKDFHVSTIAWNKSVDCCSWPDVTCDTIFGKVISLKLISYNPANTSLKSSSGLFKLQHLLELDLSNGNLQGEIPSSFENFSHLTHLDLSHNQLIGEVPDSFGNLNNLEYMALWGNNLRGNIPASFANLTKLSQLDLNRNQLTGGEIVFANLTSLRFIDLSSNNFKTSISAYLSGLQNLGSFLGSKNAFVGPFPSSLFMISSLVEINLSQNQFEGPIDFGNTSSSSHLSQLDVSDNDLDGPIPESISKLRDLYMLYLSNNNFRGRVPRSISKLVNLGVIDFTYNNLEGQIPDFVWTSIELLLLSHNSFNSFGKSVDIGDGSLMEILNIGSNSLQGPFPQWICKLTSLTNLDLSNNNFSGSIPQCLKTSPSLRVLNLRNNSFNGFIPEFNSPNLVSLDLSHNNLVGKLPKSLINCQNINLLNVNGNKIKDTFPFWISSLYSLLVLVLRSNAFYGPVYNHSTYFGFPSMRIFDISNNNFVGLLPQDYFSNWSTMSFAWSPEDSPESNYMQDGPDIYKFSIDLVYKGVETDFVKIFNAFKAIDFSGNRFSGDIPGSIGMLSELRLLNLSGNAFTGNIPSSLENITKLEALDLSRNNLSGEIPRSLGKLTFLSNINFSHNHLEGSVPQSTQFGSQNCSSFVGNPLLHGLEEICRESHHVPFPTTQQPEESLSEPEEPVLNWIAAAIAFGPGMFCGLVIGHIFTSYKHKWFMSR